MKQHANWWYGGVIGLLLVTIAIALMAGTVWLGPRQLSVALSDHGSQAFVTVFSLRVPRILSSLVCGAVWPWREPYFRPSFAIRLPIPAF